MAIEAAIRPAAAASEYQPRLAIPANLDILRTVAVSLVLVDHVLALIGDRHNIGFHGLGLAAGRCGVLLFFIHTSLVLNFSLARLGTSGWTLMRTFLVRRVFRLYPLSILCIVVVFVCNVPTTALLPSPPPRSWQDWLSNLLLTTNLTGAQPALGPLWSLPVEAQMYLVLPVIFMLLGPARSPRVALGSWLIAATYAWIYPTAGADDVTDLAPCFISGVIAYTLSGLFPKRLPGLLWLAFLPAMLATFYLCQRSIPEGFYNLPYQWIFCLGLGIALPMFHDSRCASLNWVAHRVARYSYGIYLFHSIGLWIGFGVLRDGWEPLQWTVAVAFTALASISSYHLLEKPAIDFGAALTRPPSL
jgi:peptidoglycan/LPS O-acetylase OafA/YrhL